MFAAGIHFNKGARTLFFSSYENLGRHIPRFGTITHQITCLPPKLTEFSLEMTKYFPITKNILVFLSYEKYVDVFVCKWTIWFVYLSKRDITSFQLIQTFYLWAKMAPIVRIILTVYNIFLKINVYLFITGVDLVLYPLKAKANNLCERERERFCFSVSKICQDWNLDVYLFFSVNLILGCCLKFSQFYKYWAKI